MAGAECGIRENLAKYYGQKSAPARLEGVGGEAGQTPILLTKSRRGRLRRTAPAPQHSPSQFASLMRAKVDTRGKQHDRSSCYQDLYSLSRGENLHSRASFRACQTNVRSWGKSRRHLL